MSAEIETAVFSATEGAGWTGLGLAIDPSIAKDPRKIATLLGADWTVETREAYYKTAAGTFAKIEDAAVQTRSDTGAVLSVTSANRYHVDHRQPVDILEAFRDQLAAENMTISHAAVLRGGKIIAVSAKFADTVVVNGKDVVNAYGTLSTGFDKEHGTKGSCTGVRVVCVNTLAMSISAAIRNGTLKTIRASTQISDSNVLQDLVANLPAVLADTKAVYDGMANAKMSDADVQRYFADVLEINIADLGKVDGKGNKLISTRAENMLVNLTTAYIGGPGARQAHKTLWGAVNAVTYYATHEKTCRDTSGDGMLQARVASNMFGDAAKLKARALKLAESRLAVAA